MDAAPRRKTGATSPATTSSGGRLGEQITRLQERQLDLIRQTSEELEALRLEVELQEKEKEPLMQEMERLRLQVAEVEDCREKERDQMQQVLDSLKDTVGGQIRSIHQQLRLLSLEALEGLEKLLDKVDATSLPVSPMPESKARKELPVSVLPVTLPAPRPEKKRLSAPRLRLPKRLLVGTVSFALIASLGWHAFSGQGGQVAGASTDPSIVAPTSALTDTQEPAYAEAQSDAPFAQTTWDSFTDPDFGISIDYPKNTSNLVHAASSANLFFLRKSGFMLKIAKIDTDKSFSDYMQQAQGDYGTQYALKPGTLNNRTAYVGTPLVHDDLSGTLYFVPRPPSSGSSAAPGTTVIYQVWVKDETAGSDDARRIERMVNSFQFLNLH